MSATNRNLPGNERKSEDYYSTPAWVTKAILPHINLRGPVLDPCCGDGAILDQLPTFGIGIEINKERSEIAGQKHLVIYGSALDHSQQWPICNTIITNPPYVSALPFILRAIAQGFDDIGDCAFLLRLNFLGSKKRAEFHKNHPSDIFVLPQRPSYTGDGATDATEYAWFVWGPNRGNRWQILKL